jgi:hypothetical protein
VAVEKRELGTSDVLVMQDRLRRAGDDSKAVALEHWLGKIAAVRKKSGRPRFDCAFAHGSGF